MTIASEANRSGPYACNGATTHFPYAFKIFEAAHVRVILTDEAGVETTLSLGADYAVSGVGDDGGGAVETAVAHPSGCLVTLVLNVPFIQEIDLENQGAYFAETIERALDEGVQRDLQLAEEVARAFKLRPSAELVAAGAVFVSDGDGGATGGPSAADIETARNVAVAASGAAAQAATMAGQKAQIAADAADRAETAATSVEGAVSYAVEQQLTDGEKARALENLGLDKALTPFGFTAAEGQSAFDLGMSPAPNACIVSQNGAWLVGGVDYAIAGPTLTLATAAEAGDRISGVAISSFEVANALVPAANLADLGNKAVARGNLGLGSAAVENAGTGPGEVLRLDAGGRIPAVDGAQIGGIGRKLISITNIDAATFADIVLPDGYSQVELQLLGNTAAHILSMRARVKGAGSLLAGATDYKGIFQYRVTGCATTDFSSGAASFALNPSVAWTDVDILVDNLSGLVRANGWLAGAEFSAAGRIQTPGPYDLVRLIPSTGTFTCVCRLFGIKDAS